jgi:hypothetical protein
MRVFNFTKWHRVPEANLRLSGDTKCNEQRAEVFGQMLWGCLISGYENILKETIFGSVPFTVSSFTHTNTVSLSNEHTNDAMSSCNCLLFVSVNVSEYPDLNLNSVQLPHLISIPSQSNPSVMVQAPNFLQEHLFLKVRIWLVSGLLLLVFSKSTKSSASNVRNFVLHIIRWVLALTVLSEEK